MADGILDRLGTASKHPGLTQALLTLGANLMAAGGPSFDPGASSRSVARGVEGFGSQLQRGRLLSDRLETTKQNRDMRALQISDFRQKQGAMEKLREQLQPPQADPQAYPTGAGSEADIGAEPTAQSFESNPLYRGIDPKLHALTAQIYQAYPQLAAKKLGAPPAKGVVVGNNGVLVNPLTGQVMARNKVPVPQYSGRVDLDQQVGKFYQTNPKTGKREYVSPNEEFLIEGDAEGGWRIRKGPAGAGGGVTRKTAGALEQRLVAAQEGLVRLKDIASKYRPEFQEFETRLGAAWTSLKAKTGLGDISSEDRQQLTDFADYRRGAIENINLYIKEITGAQMSEKEASRLRLAQPDPGEGIFSGDDPITFKAKMDSAILASEKAIARFNYYRAKGITNVYEMANKSPLSAIQTAVNPQTGERRIFIDNQWVPM